MAHSSFPEQPAWFRDSRDFGKLAAGLRNVGFAEPEVARIMGLNWLDFFERSFFPAGAARHAPLAEAGE